MNKVNTGIETVQKIIDGLLNAPTIGGNCYKIFFKARLVDKTTSFFAPIKRTNIDTLIPDTTCLLIMAVTSWDLG